MVIAYFLKACILLLTNNYLLFLVLLITCFTIENLNNNKIIYFIIKVI